MSDRRLRTWVWAGDPKVTQVAWIAELGDEWYLRCTREGSAEHYWSGKIPPESHMGLHWKEIDP
jgi:hypothetical protein